MGLSLSPLARRRSKLYEIDTNYNTCTFCKNDGLYWGREANMNSNPGMKYGVVPKGKPEYESLNFEISRTNDNACVDSQ